MGKHLEPKEFTVVWRTKVVATSAADAARKTLHLKPQGVSVATVCSDSCRQVDVLVKEAR